MSAAGSVTADELVRALERRGATLPAEIAAFIVLEGCETMLQSGPRELADLRHVRISEQGDVSLSGAACTDVRGMRDLHGVLGRLLAAAGESLSPSLRALAEHGPRGADASLRGLRDELEAALVPLNRNASRRVLARFAREAAQPPAEAREVDPALRSLLGSEPANDADAAAAAALNFVPGPLPPDLLASLVPSLDAKPHYLENGVAMPMHERAAGDGYAPPRTRSVRPSFAPSAELHGFRAQHASEEQLVEVPPGGASTQRRLFIGLAVLALACAGVALAFSLRSPAPAPHDPAGGAVLAPSSSELVVRVSQPGVQVFRYVGMAPLSVGPLPTGVAHELVVLLEAHAPERVVVPADATWERGPAGTHFNVVAKLRPYTEAELEQPVLLGESVLREVPRAPANAPQGHVRVISAPPGARVYRLLGFSPELRIPDVSTGEPHELLIYRDGYLPIVHTVEPGDFVTQGTRRVAEVSVSLEKQQP